MRQALFHTHLDHEDLECALLILYILILVVVVTWGAWHMLTALAYVSDLCKPESMQFWQ